MKEIYIEIMERALAAYDDETIAGYIKSVKTDGLREHGFPRLTANIGILISKGRSLNMLPGFIEMMTLCCDQMPDKKGVANDFSVKEICFALMELEKTELIDKSLIEEWKGKIRALNSFESYDCIAVDPSKHYANWAAFAGASEFLRMHYLGVDTTDFVEMELASQVISFNENGLYKEPHHPILYDFVGRLELSVPLFFGYDGKYAAIIDENLKKAGETSLKYQSVNGELAYGGRSAAFLYNESVMSAVYEFEATRYHKLGEREKAGEFKAAALYAARSLMSQLEVYPGHIKNHYDPNAKIACEDYAYFLKYMITVASYAYNAYLYADDDIMPTICPAERGGYIMETDADFHKIIANSGDYYLQFETNADFHYDANGLGRIHKKGVPSELCISTSFVTDPTYTPELPNKFDASLCCYVEDSEGFFTGAQEGVKYKKVSEKIENGYLQFTLECALTNGAIAEQRYEITEHGIDITLRSSENAGFILPVFLFDGKDYTITDINEDKVTVSYKGHTCRYIFDGELQKTGEVMSNRNGRYEIFKLRGSSLHIEME